MYMLIISICMYIYVRICMDNIFTLTLFMNLINLVLEKAFFSEKPEKKVLWQEP